MRTKREMVLTSQLGIGLACCLASVLLVAMGIFGWFEYEWFKARVRKSAGDIVRSGDGSHRVFRFQTPDETVEIVARPRSGFGHDPLGAHIEIFYDPANPRRVVRVRSFNFSEEYGLGLIYAAPFIFIAGVIAVWVDRRRVRNKWEAIDALAATGVDVPRPALQVFFFE
jgi:hypothetical protein